VCGDTETINKNLIIAFNKYPPEEGIFMRMIHVWILKPDGSTQWYTIPWGKRHLDQIRKEGVIIFSSF
jgi:hypothetical protein